MKSALLSVLVSCVALAETPPAAPAAPAQTTPGSGMEAAPIEQAEHAILVDGFTYMDFEWVTYDPTATYVGRNNGFRIANMRLDLQGRPLGRFGFDVSIDAAAGVRSPVTSLIGSLTTQLVDGYVWFDILPELRLKVGQFVTPYGAETLLPDDDLPFVRRSIVTGGIQAPESNIDIPGVFGYYCAFTACRSLGLSLRYATPHDRPGFSAELVVANGNGANQILNDNNLFLVLGRIEAWTGSHLAFGLNAYYDPRTIYDPQGYFFDETDIAVGADITAHFGGLRLMAMFLGKETRYVTTGAPMSRTWGAVGQAIYTLPDTLLGLQVGDRFAYYQPNDTIPQGEVYEDDIVVAYPFPRIPVRLILQVSLRFWDPARAQNDSGVDAMLQAVF